MPSLLGSHYLGHNGWQTDYQQLKITLKQRTVSENNIMQLG